MRLRKQEKVLNQKQTKINNQLESNERKMQSYCGWKLVSYMLKVLTPFRVAIGICCLSMSCLIIYSMLINNIDRLLNSECGFKCGFLLDKSPSYFNPLDSLLKVLSNHHENFYSIQLFLDTSFFALILLYTFICIIYGIVKIGINFFGLEIYKIRRRDTMPQALSVVSILVILMMFAFSMQLMSIAPNYVTFGDQKLKKEDNSSDNENCSLKEGKIDNF